MAASPAVELGLVRDLSDLAAKLTDRDIGGICPCRCKESDFCLVAGVIRLRRPLLTGANTTRLWVGESIAMPICEFQAIAMIYMMRDQPKQNRDVTNTTRVRSKVSLKLPKSK